MGDWMQPVRLRARVAVRRDNPLVRMSRPPWTTVYRLIAVIIPELVETHWCEYLLHNHLATWLKADLMLQEEQRIVVINLPWYLS